VIDVDPSEQTTCEVGFTVTCAVGLTVMVKISGGPVQDTEPFEKVGVTVIVALIA
jgi:hypothetical protein